jgi:hypothetical protein
MALVSPSEYSAEETPEEFDKTLERGWEVVQGFPLPAMDAP